MYIVQMRKLRSEEFDTYCQCQDLNPHILIFLLVSVHYTGGSYSYYYNNISQEV